MKMIEEKLRNLKVCLDDIERKEEEDAALKLLTKYNLEGESPTLYKKGDVEINRGNQERNSWQYQEDKPDQEN